MPSTEALIPVCIGCHKHPDQLDEYIECAKEEGMTPDTFVREEEGTYNPTNAHFLCTKCYIERGCPSSIIGWKAP